MAPVKTTRYWEDLNRSIGQCWNRFWFTPTDPLPLCLLRIAVGLLALAYLVSFSGELVALTASGMDTGWWAYDTFKTGIKSSVL